MENGAVSNVPAILLARTTIGPNVPETLGVPLSTPAALKLNPVGSVPEKTENVGAGKPFATKLYVARPRSECHLAGFVR
jgi:hypothetical protein